MILSDLDESIEAKRGQIEAKKKYNLEVIEEIKERFNKINVNRGQIQELERGIKDDQIAKEEEKKGCEEVKRKLQCTQAILDVSILDINSKS